MLRRVLFVALWASLFGLTSRAVADNASAVPVWAMQGGDPGHTNQSSLLAPQTDIHKLWKVDLGADSFCQPVIGATGTIYVTNDLGQLIAVSPQGQKLWTFSGASIKASPPTIGNDGTIYFGSGDYVSEGNNAYVYAVNPDGTQRWRANTGSSHPYSPLIDLQGRIHVTTWTQSGTGSYYCLNPDGSRAWSGQGIGSPALLPNGSTVVQMRTGFRCYNSSGTAVWTAVFGYSLDAPIVAGNGDLYAACYDATAWKIDPATGAKLQTINTGLNAVANLSIDDDSHRLYLSDDTYLRSFDLSGNLQWSYSGTGGRSGPALIDAAGNLLSAQGQLGNGIDYISSSGSLLWHFAADEPAHHFGTPTLGTGGVVYATNWTYNGSSGYLYAVVPEPSTLALLGIGALGLFGYCCQRRKVSPRLVTCFAAVVVALSVAFAQAADVFNMGTGQTSLLTVPVGDAGNVADTAPQGAVRYGAVGYKYDIGKYDVTNAQYCEFLNAKASASDPYGLWSSRMASDACGGITCSGSGPYTYAVKPGQGSQPVVFASWYDTLRFANWLTNGQGSGSTESGAYAISGSGPYWTVAVPSAAQRATWAAGNKRYWLLPSENEWYKAAYYKGGGTNSGYWLYPTQSDNTPTWELSTSTGPNPGANSGNFRDKTHGYSVTGSTSNDPSQDYLTDVGAYPNSLSAYGTLDQGGELWQWNDQFYSTSLRCVRGGYWGDISGLLASSFRGICESTTEGNDIGFRVASVGVPEPNSVALVVVGGLSLLGYAWRRRMPHSRRPAILAAVAFVGLASCPVLAATYVAIDLSPSGFAESEGYGACGTQQVGYGQTTKNSGTTHALLWSGTANSVVDLTLSGFTQSYAWATNGMQQVGNGYGSATAGNTHAILWSGTAASAVDLNPTGFDGSLAYGISGTQQVGQGYGTATGGDHHALLWNGTANSAVDINPSGFSYSYAWATVGTQQVGQGYGPVTGGKYHALVWGGNAASAVDLNPAGFNLTVAFATNGSQQVGDGYGTPTGGNYHALLWSGTASSAVDLNPSGFSMSGATGISDTQEVGYGYGTATGGNYHALLWNGTAASAVDLSQFLPAGFVESYAKGIDAQGNIIGYAVDASGNDHAILWKPVPEPSTLALFGVGALGLLRFSWRRRRGRARCLS